MRTHGIGGNPVTDRKAGLATPLDAKEPIVVYRGRYGLTVTGQWVKQIGWPGHLLAVFLAWPGARSTSCSEVERESAYHVID